MVKNLVIAIAILSVFLVASLAALGVMTWTGIQKDGQIVALKNTLEHIQLRADAEAYQTDINGDALTECRENLEKWEKNLSAYSEDLHTVSLAVAYGVVGDEIRSISSYSLQEGLAWRVEAHRDYVQIQRPGSATIVPLAR
ncbi:MAG TPA: hypothetical protein VFE94_01980 [Candidatus Paceibacterota bacterium]|nr:hypothetical protein [Candidatus Paceibacterota bacterium]